MSKSSGYVVLRKPKDNYDPQGRGAFSANIPVVNDVYYSGLDRMSWFDVEEDYYSGGLGDYQKVIFNRITSNISIFGVMLSDEFGDALDLLNYSDSKNELVFVCSGKKQGPTDFPYCKLDPLGLDLIIDGYGSLIRNGFFYKPDYFIPNDISLNRNGLIDIDGLSDVYNYLSVYKKFKGELEPVDEKHIIKTYLYRVEL